MTKAQDNIIVELGGKPPLVQLQELWQELDPGDQELFRRGLHIGRLRGDEPIKQCLRAAEIEISDHLQNAQAPSRIVRGFHQLTTNSSSAAR